jgi:serine/threonine protein kinase
MGEVYKARDTRLDRTVAIKVLPEHRYGTPQARERFEREAKAISTLNHPHICTLHDVGQQDGIDYLVMEYLEGETLADRLKKGPLPLDQVLQYAIQIGDALDAALILSPMPALRSATSLTLYSANVPSTWATSDGVNL